ncbi:SusD/RagB family nutrient-binding outer membrane lipoprotein [Niabella aurantiaca]|uniref:SusD/RagB family nutrient-binding outer membrane lipoprotein n=1 Tax=Niabella aurantiaca TaxID=379900 RepID=UPI000379CAAA|nr:SusD/RagB family nutrient-binding outer membrane lipoprotein [Niabella aurantiaca]
MKNLKYILLGGVLVLGSASCKKWLDVNTDPDNPNNQTVLIQNRLPWMEHFYQYSSGVANFRTACQAGVYYSNSATPNSFTTTWQCSSSNSTTPYQTWFVAVSSNVVDIYNSAQEKGAYHYMAAADVIHALGYMQMLDIYGEMPYTEAGTGNPSPKPDDGKTIFNGCMARLNEAISLFSKAQEAGAPALSEGDLWNNGDVGKWLKMCWGLKARYMLKLSKKSDLYNADSILYCLSQGPQSIADNIVGPGLNNSTVTDFLIQDPVVTNGNWNYAAYGSSTRISQFHYNLLVNMRGKGITDPRMTKIVPASMANVKLGDNGKVASYSWNRAVGVDSYGPASRLVKGGATSVATATYAADSTDKEYTIADAADRAAFIAAQTAAGRDFTIDGNKVTVTYLPGSIYIGSTNYVLAGDTVYVNLRSASQATKGSVPQPETDVNWYPSPEAYTAGVIGSTGSFQVRPVSDQEILTYHEMCFIKAEVYMRKNERGNALTAYRDGIKAHLDMMQAKLTEWKAAQYNNPDMWPMEQSAVNAYLQSDAVCKDAGTLTMADIMLQKYVAMGCSIENWNDMRRFNFSAGDVEGFGNVYPGYKRGPLFTGQAQLTGGSPTDPRYWMRRWMLPPTYEINYNSVNTLALNPHAADLNIWSMPIWWDCATDDEYYGYLK